MVSDDKEKLNNTVVNEQNVSEDELIKKKIEAVMKARAKEYAKAKLESEKKAEQAAVQEIEAQVETVKPNEKSAVPPEEEPVKAERIEEKKSDAASVAAAYAKYLKEHNLKPGDATFINPADIGVVIEDEKPRQDFVFSDEEIKAAIHKAEALYEEVKEDKSAKIISRERVQTGEQKKVEKETIGKTVAPKVKTEKTAKKAKPAKQKDGSLMDGIRTVFAAPIFLHDRIQDAVDDFFIGLYRDIVAGVYKTVNGYRNSQREIGIALLVICAVCGIVVMVLDHNTVYEYSYNGKALGYVDSQDDVTNVLAIAGEKLNSVNKSAGEEIEFTAGDNITFKSVEASEKDIDDADATVNKLAYMTDIEVEAYGVYDGNNLVTIVKSEKAAETLLEEVKDILGTPDEGMEVVSVEFNKQLEIKPVNVLLTSVQSNAAAKKQMTEGGEVDFYHLVEQDETMMSIAEDFGVDKSAIYDEDNKNAKTSADTGEKVCIRKTVEPVSVKLVETGKMKEIVPYETIKKNSKKYYIGDEVVGVKGVKGIQIFEGTVTKVGGKVTDRDTESLEVIREKVDKVIYVGTTKRPKTAPTGTFKNPMAAGTYVVTSRPGQRWGRMHEGVDMGASTGTPVYASDGGTVTYSGMQSGYGNLIIIEHANGWTTRYGHLSYRGVSVGDKVYQGQYIGDVGSTGRSTGPHLHFETRKDGVFVNPDTKVEGGL